MQKIEIDEEVYLYLQKNALAYVEDTPNKTLRRLFGLNRQSNKHLRHVKVGKKRPRTSLQKLINIGVLKDGQDLHMCDYQKRIIPEVNAKVDGNYILYKNKHYSMSQLAKDILIENGYSSKEVRGPEFWYTSNNINIRTLWDRYLDDM